MDSKRGSAVALMVAEMIAREPLPIPPSTADTGTVPRRENGCSDTCASNGCDSTKPWPTLRADTAPVPHGQNSCEGSDCAHYDLPV